MRAAHQFPAGSEGMDAEVDTNQVRKYVGMKTSRTKFITMTDTKASTTRCQNYNQCEHLQPWAMNGYTFMNVSI